MSITQFPIQAWETLAESAKAHAVREDRAEAFTKDNTEPLDKELVFGPTLNIDNAFEDPVLVYLVQVIKKLSTSEYMSISFQVMMGPNTYVTLKVTGPVEVRKSGPSLVEVVSKKTK